MQMQVTPRTTLIVTPRERFSLAVRSLKSIIETTDGSYDLIYVDGKAPRKIASQISALCEEAGFQYLRFSRFLSPNQARNIGLQRASSELVVFIDNDVIVSTDWLNQLEKCANEMNAEVICPLTCQREPLHSEIHQAGGEIAANLEDFLSGKREGRQLVDRHILQGKPVETAPRGRTLVQACEFHCVMVRRSLFDRIGPLDEELLATKEHLDFSLSVWASGGQVVMEPRAIVTYLFPAGSNKLEASDWPYFALRWSPVWLRASLAHFQHKWSLADDPYFAQRAHMLDWRHVEGIVRPALKRVPFLPRRGKANKVATWLGKRLLERWSYSMAKRHQRHWEKPIALKGPEMARAAGRDSLGHS